MPCSTITLVPCAWLLSGALEVWSLITITITKVLSFVQPLQRVYDFAGLGYSQPEGSILGRGWGGVATPKFWAEGRGRVVRYYYILLCTGSMFEFESGEF